MGILMLLVNSSAMGTYLAIKSSSSSSDSLSLYFRAYSGRFPDIYLNAKNRLENKLILNVVMNNFGHIWSRSDLQIFWQIYNKVQGSGKNDLYDSVVGPDLCI